MNINLTISLKFPKRVLDLAERLLEGTVQEKPQHGQNTMVREDPNTIDLQDMKNFELPKDYRIEKEEDVPEEYEEVNEFDQNSTNG